jgi:hypothetical protein
MKKTITLLLVALFTAVLSAQTVTIGGTSYPTITDAITAANNGDVILISGIHTEPIAIGKSITLRGANPATDIIQAAAAPATDGTGSRVVSLAPPVNTDILTITIENLGIRNGNFNANGGGINADKIMGLLSLNNLIIANNFTTTNGGGIGIAGSNVNMTNCTIQNNSSSLDGGAIIAAPNNNNGNGINSFINIRQSLINSNNGRNGGGIYINGNNGFGNDYSINVIVENSTISNNTAFSPSSGNGGGAIFCTSFPLTSNAAVGNASLTFVHATVYNNMHANLVKAGVQFGGNAATPATFSAYNSIIVAADDLNTKALNFANANTTNVVNCILGGLNAGPTLIDDVGKNNLKGRTATQSGLTGTLSNQGGSTQVLAIAAASAAVDYCTATTGVTIPAIDQRGYTRTGTYDAGAYELGAALSVGDQNYENSSVKIYPNPTKGFVKISGADTVNSVRVYSILGTLEKEIHNQSEFDVSGLSTGIHLIVIIGDNQNIVKRIIIE